jgi:hypothetical protein
MGDTEVVGAAYAETRALERRVSLALIVVGAVRGRTSSRVHVDGRSSSRLDVDGVIFSLNNVDEGWPHSEMC